MPFSCVDVDLAGGEGGEGAADRVAPFTVGRALGEEAMGTRCAADVSASSPTRLRFVSVLGFSGLSLIEDIVDDEEPKPGD